MACLGERITAYAAAAAAGIAWAAVPVEVFSGILAPASIPTVAIATTATAAAVGAGVSLADCLRAHGMTAQADALEQHYDRLAAQNQSMEQLINSVAA